MVCKHCGRKTSSPPTKGGTGWRGGIATAAIVLLAAATATGVFHARQVKIARQRAVDDSLAAAQQSAKARAIDSADAATVRFVPVFDEVVTVQPRSYWIGSFEVTKGTHCALYGTMNGVGGGDEFSAFVLSEDELVRWQATRQADRTAWEVDAVTSATISAPIPRDGKYALVVSNQAAFFLKHNVMTKAQLGCTRDWRPRA